MSARIPNCFVAGAPRCGTTFLSLALAAHPDAYVCDMKEPHFFGAPPQGYHYDGPGDSYLNGTWVSDEERYLSLYRDRAERVWIDGSTTLMFWPDAVREIVRRQPEATFFVVLRDPVARAESAYTRHRGQGLEPAPRLVDAIDDELAGRRSTWSPGFRYVEQGRYGAALDELEPMLGQRLHVLRFDDLIAAPEPSIRAAWRALGLADDVEVVIPEETNASPDVGNRLLTYLFVRPLRIRSAVAARLPERLVERAKAWRASQRATTDDDTEARHRLREIYADDLRRLEQRRGIVLASRP